MTDEFEKAREKAAYDWAVKDWGHSFFPDATEVDKEEFIKDHVKKFLAGADWAREYFEKRITDLEARLESKKTKLLKRDCDCGYEGPDSDHSYLSPMCYRCEDLTDLDEILARLRGNKESE